jgi:MerR family transcriptional regulator, thiopeptide resistance regulator
MKLLTITRLARDYGLSRSTLLYYDRIGLLPAPRRTAAGYRYYTHQDRQRLARICSLRQARLALADIRIMLSTDAHRRARIVERRLQEVQIELQSLQASQRLLTKLLHKMAAHSSPRMAGKQMWIDMMRAAGMDESGMAKWHAEFERRAPDEHHQLLRFLGIAETEIRQIRQWSRSSPQTPG